MGLRAPRQLAVIREDLVAIVGMWRRLLVAHTPTGQQGRCPKCRRWWGRQRRWPCRVWTAGHRVLAQLQRPAASASEIVPEPGASTPVSGAGRHAADNTERAAGVRVIARPPGRQTGVEVTVR